MSVRRYIAAIISAHRKNKEEYKRKPISYEEEKRKITKEQHFKWADEGLCYSCGAPSGEEQGICDECRWS